MSVGGTVVEVIDTEDGRLWVDTRERETSRHTCAIYVERTEVSRCIEVGDSLWWQGSYAMWTPRRGRFRDAPPFSDKKIKRVSGSGVNRPTPTPKGGARDG